eukprot:TRINITY_DN30974_c0_g1_i1.p1 TRINITY_DN30974_c0_g1~~TRINITY_DN30974_c0_g1_i1.p1  ORF type:complete len:114 (-),score=10.26 TRINITY_DN30974_c0_g1_i1:48-389(-)
MQLFAALAVDGNLWGWGIARSVLPQTPICLIDTGDVVAYDVGAAFVVAALASGRIVQFSKYTDSGGGICTTPEYCTIGRLNDDTDVGGDKMSAATVITRYPCLLYTSPSPRDS